MSNCHKKNTKSLEIHFQNHSIKQLEDKIVLSRNTVAPKILASLFLIAVAGCYNSPSIEQRRSERIKMNPVYNQKMAEKSTTEGRIKYFLANGDTVAAKEEMRILKLQEMEIEDAMKKADTGETPAWIYNNLKGSQEDSK